MISRDNRDALILLIVLLLCSVAPFASAPSRAQENPTAAELVTEYLGQDVFLRPGVGLDAVRIGMEFDQVLQTWGQPTKDLRNDIGGKKWIYQLAQHTSITLVGGNRVTSMTIAGGFNSPYVTTEGAAFGMPRHQLASIYGAADPDSDQVRYENRGIGFGLERGQVVEMTVFSPE